MVRDFTTKPDQDEVEFYNATVAWEGQSFKGFIEDMHDAFQVGETVSKLINDFYGQSQKGRETKDTFVNDSHKTIFSFRGQPPAQGLVCT